MLEKGPTDATLQSEYIRSIVHTVKLDPLVFQEDLLYSN